MDPVGPQKKIKSNEMNVHSQKLMDSPAKKNLGGGFNTSSGTRAADKLSSTNEKFQGTVKGKTKHTYKIGD